MIFGRWVLGALVGGLGLGAVGTRAAPLPGMPADGPATMQQVQFFFYDQDEPAPPPRWYRYDDRPPPPRWYRNDGWSPHPYGAPPPAAYGPPSYGREAAKDYVKNYRRTQKEIVKERARAWNEQHGF